MTDIAEWQGGVGRNWATEWERTDRSFAGLTPGLLDAIAGEPGLRIVDVGCGAGEIALAVAAARPDAHVTGVDVSPELVTAARERGEDIANVRFLLADATLWADPHGAPELYVSRHGVMFFPDPPVAFGHLAKVAAPGARFVFSCFRASAENEWAVEIAKLLPPPAPTGAQPFPPGPFAFADPEHVQRCMAGWRDFAFTAVDYDYIAGAGPDPVADALAFFARIGPTALAIRTLPESAKASFMAKLEALVRSRLVGGKVSFRAAAWLVTATVDHHSG